MKLAGETPSPFLFVPGKRTDKNDVGPIPYRYVTMILMS